MGLWPICSHNVRREAALTTADVTQRRMGECVVLIFVSHKPTIHETQPKRARCALRHPEPLHSKSYRIIDVNYLL